jgi:zinc protease
MKGERREVFPSPVQLPRIYRLYHIPKMGEDAWYAADLLSTILTADKASRLEKTLVMEQQIAQDVSAYVLPTESTGVFLLQTTAREGVSASELEAALDVELARLTTGTISEAELTRAMNRAEVDYAHQVENYDSRADMIAMLATYFGEAEMMTRWLDSYRARTPQEVVAVARQILVADNRVTIHFVPQDSR